MQTVGPSPRCCTSNFKGRNKKTERHSHIQEVRLTTGEREIRHETIRRDGSRRVRRAPVEGGRRRTGVDRRRHSRVGGKRSRIFAGISSREVRALERKLRETPPVPKIRRGGSQGHRPVRGAASKRVRQLVVAVAGRKGRGVGDRGCSPNPDAARTPRFALRALAEPGRAHPLGKKRRYRGHSIGFRGPVPRRRGGPPRRTI